MTNNDKQWVALVNISDSILSRNRKEVECMRSWLWLEWSGLAPMPGRARLWLSRKGNNWPRERIGEGGGQKGEGL